MKILINATYDKQTKYIKIRFKKQLKNLKNEQEEKSPLANQLLN